MYSAKTRLQRWPYVLVSLWLAFTLSLTAWWMMFGMHQIDTMRMLDPKEENQLLRQQRMLLWEGGTLFLSLAVGASALAIMSFRSARQAQAIQEFLAVFTHELKTPLASLRLQAESLVDATEDAKLNPQVDVNAAVSGITQRLVSDTARLSLRLDNALFIATKGKEKFFFEKISLSDLLENLRLTWPSLAITLDKETVVLADKRAIETIFSNIFQNASTHGKADTIRLQTEVQKLSTSVTILSNGKSFEGNPANLGKLFSRSYHGSGSSIGLYIVKRLMEAQGGSVSFPELGESAGFTVKLEFKR